MLMASRRPEHTQSTTSESASLTKGDKSAEDVGEVDVASISKPSGGDTAVGRTPRVLPPFIAAHDVPRGFAYAVQALLAYLLMLAVMYVASHQSRIITLNSVWMVTGHSKRHISSPSLWG